MSYCRWSSDNWMCDLYCYGDVTGGFTTHIAARKRAYSPPDDGVADFLDGKITPEEYSRRHRATMDAMDSIPLVPITLPYAGETFNDATLEEFRERLIELRRVGYRFPDYALGRVEQEIADANDRKRA